MQLPTSNVIDVATLATIFNSTTTSYKFLFFKALLHLIKKGLFQKNSFLFEELEEEMVSIASYSINVCKLNFGTQDQMVEKIKTGKSISLTRYVPYRLLTPFFSNELKRKKDIEKNKIIEELSKNTARVQGPAIYKIEGGKIELHLQWMEYLKNHFAIVEGWVSWHWIDYLQGKNPNVLSLGHKLQQPSKRISLSKQTKYWKEILNNEKIDCIFSGEPITKLNLSLDHFLPWSFIGHNQLWNLIPVSTNINSSKSDNIPSIDYLDKFIDAQILGLKTSKEYMREKAWKEYTDDFVIGLNIDFSDLINEEKIRIRYGETIRPLIDIANNIGFNSEWLYK